MKTLLFTLFLLPSLSVASTVDELARNVRIAKATIQIHSIRLQYLQDLSKLTPTDANELAERDLAICEGVGALESSIGSIQESDDAVGKMLTNQVDLQEMDSLEWALIQAWAEMRPFCIHVNDKLYRNALHLQERAQKSQNILEALTDILNKYE